MCSAHAFCPEAVIYKHIISRNEYLISLAESAIPRVYSLQFLCKSVTVTCYQMNCNLDSNPGWDVQKPFYPSLNHWLYFNANISTVYVAALDISKAYDKVNHYKLFSSLISAGLPKWFNDLLLCWYEKLVVTVRWNGCFSYEFCVQSGVRQGSSLSPSIFNVLIDFFK